MHEVRAATTHRAAPTPRRDLPPPGALLGYPAPGQSQEPSTTQADRCRQRWLRETRILLFTLGGKNHWQLLGVSTPKVPAGYKAHHSAEVCNLPFVPLPSASF